ncbi:hypothetical protein BT96DRAFT_992270 [Gymnopus androsaceus JB14]|uniref:SET domain-containing protein n=1 Tax=Gymnopus androsaceus JB14 TaxID=1447944 RepID=A0A6A4HTE3_9AGAR|nr:hypothetical protein BT96DRAFT_992270 [Gymnopus androsaceus JB14]
MVSSSSSSSSSPSRRVKPAMSILTSSPSKKSRRGSVQISPLQPSAIANGASVPSLNTESKVPSTKVSSGANHTRKKTESISISHRVASTCSDSGEKAKQRSRCGSFHRWSMGITRSDLPSLMLLEEVRTTVYSDAVAVLGSDVVLPPAVSQQTELDSAVARAPSPAEKQREPYIVRAVEGGGMGMFAQTFIPQGGVILVERPAVILPADAKARCSPCLVFDGLEPRHRPFEALFRSRSWQDPSGDLSYQCTGYRAGNKLTRRTESQSAVHQDILDVITAAAPTPSGALTSHTFTLTLSAVRRISPNEEITISYINNPVPSSTPPHCDVPWTSPGALTQSDKARMELCSFFDTVLDWEDWCLDENLKTGYDEHDLIGMHFRAMQLREMEGLQGFMGGVASR